MQLNVSGYVGWRQMISKVDYDSVPSEPELGLMTSLKVTDRLNFFNQLKWGKSFDEVLVYSQVSYTPYIPIDDFTLTLKAGKLRYDNSLYNITRINPRTRQGVFQPQSLYWNTLAQTITSGIGVGFDFSYKNLSGSFVIDKQVIDNPRKESRAWTTRNFTNMTAKFGQHHTASLQYVIPEEGLRFKTSWNKSKFDIPIGAGALIGAPDALTFGVEYWMLGAEWSHGKWVHALEFQMTKKDGTNWSQTGKLAYGASLTNEYDINENWTIRSNVNFYQSAAVVNLPQEKYNRDINLGINWHHADWLVGAEVHYIRGGRIVDPDNFAANPEDYKSFYVIGLNAAYFFD